MRARWLRILGLAFLWAAGARAETLTFGSLQALIQNHHVRSVDELLPWLPAEYRANYVLVHTSRAPEAASTSRAYPRVAMFGSDAKFILAFSGDPKFTHDYDRAQILEYVAAERRFYPREITFGPRLAFNAHPVACLGCHGADAKPLWEGDPYWPGVYGSVQDAFEEGSEEWAAFQAFLRNQKNQGRYARLQAPAHYRVVENLEDLLRHETPAQRAERLAQAPNTRFTRALLALNAERVARRWRQSPAFAAYKFEAAWRLLDCDTSPEQADEVSREASEIKKFLYFRVNNSLETPHGDVNDRFGSLQDRLAASAVILTRVGASLGMDFRQMSLSAFDVRGFADALNDGDDPRFKGLALAIHDDERTLASYLALTLLKDIARERPRLRRLLALGDDPSRYEDAGVLARAIKQNYWNQRDAVCAAVLER